MVLVEVLLNGSVFHGYMGTVSKLAVFSQTLHQLIYFANYVPSWLSPNLIIHGTEVGTVGGHRSGVINTMVHVAAARKSQMHIIHSALHNPARKCRSLGWCVRWLAATV